MSILTYSLCALSGGLIEVSAGIGFWPRWKQPKNIRIQLWTGIIGMIGLLISAVIILKS